MKLYTTRVAPNPRRVAIFLAEKGIEVPTVEIDLAAKENLLPEFLARNPLGLLPCRVDGDLPLFRGDQPGAGAIRVWRPGAG
jgi:glutathione S-transferase